MKFLYQLLSLMLLVGLPASAMAQVCDVSDVIFASQAEVDDFQSTYGPCTEISGDLKIIGPILGGSDVTSLAAFNGIARVGFPQGLDQMGDDLNLSNNPVLNDIEALSNLLIVINLYIRDNDILQQLTGLDNIQAVEGSLGVYRNPQLTDCNSILSLVDDVDDFAPGPGPGVSGVPDVRQQVTLQDNQPTCNSEYLMEGFMFENGFE